MLGRPERPPHDGSGHIDGPRVHRRHAVACDRHSCCRRTHRALHQGPEAIAAAVSLSSGVPARQLLLKSGCWRRVSGSPAGGSFSPLAGSQGQLRVLKEHGRWPHRWPQKVMPLTTPDDPAMPGRHLHSSSRRTSWPSATRRSAKRFSRRCPDDDPSPEGLLTCPSPSRDEAALNSLPVRPARGDSSTCSSSARPGVVDGQ